MHFRAWKQLLARSPTPLYLTLSSSWAVQQQGKASAQQGPREGGSMQRLLSAHGVAVDATVSKEPGQTDACRQAQIKSWCLSSVPDA